MIKKYNREKGITLISLVITVVIMIIIASVAVTTGISTKNRAKFFGAIAQLKTMQSEVNSWYEEYKNGNGEILNYGENITDNLVDSYNKKVSNLIDDAFSVLEIEASKKSEFRFFSIEYIKDTLKIGGIDEEFFIDIKNRNVILAYGVDYGGKKYYSLSQVNNGGYNVEYTGEEEISPSSNEYNSDEINIDVPKVSGKEMIPIVWDQGRLAWIKADVSWDETLNRWSQVSNSNLKWYDYSKEEKKWANVATIVNDGTNSREYYMQCQPGTEILMNDISCMYVWIPKFACKKTYYIDATYSTITASQTNFVNTDVKFLNETQNAPEGYEIESEGFWIAKFEASNFTSSAPKSNTGKKYGGPKINDTIDVPTNDLEDYIKIKPNLTSWRNLAIESDTAENLNHVIEIINEDAENVYGLSSKSETGLVTLSMWEAVGDLAQSEYGNRLDKDNQTVYGNFFYQGDGTASECNYTTQTGIVAALNGNDYSGITDITKLVTQKRIENSGIITINDTFNYNEYWTENGKNGSTSSNIYGVYDMIGGAKEYVVNTIGDANYYYVMSGNFADTGERATYYYKSNEINDLTSKDKSVGFRTCITIGNEGSIV